MTETSQNTHATLTITSKGEKWGEIVLRFFPDVAPNHVKNFMTLAGDFTTAQLFIGSFPDS